MEVFVKQSSNYFSPLRYPGGKASLSLFLGETIRNNDLFNFTYVEPFAGGAGAALELLFLEKIKKIHINDYDLAIYAIWHCILYETEKFVKKISDASITLKEWYKQKEIYNSKTNNIFELGFATFYLNRTNRSGIITGGPIGGMEQSGAYKIDARFNSKKLIQRIQKIALYEKRITLTNKDGIELMRTLDHSKSFFYIDPPYYIKGEDLYLNHFNHDDHIALSNYLNSNNESYWLLTYDNVDQIKSLYKNRKSSEFSLNYYAGDIKKGKEIMVFSDKISEVDTPLQLQLDMFN